MISPKNHDKETERLAALDSFSILDTLPEEDYDNLTALAAEICGTPISLVSLLDKDRQWFKSHHGLDVSETPKEYAFCAHAINAEEDIFVVQDSRNDERFRDNPLVIGEPRVIFYAGIPLCDANGLPLGTLCVIDHEPRSLSQRQRNSLRSLAKQVMNILQLRRKNELLNLSIQALFDKNAALERFAHVAAHDLKSPLNNITSTAELLTEFYGPAMDEDGRTMLSFIHSASNRLRGLIDGLLSHSKSSTFIQENISHIDLESFGKEIHGLFSYDQSLNLTIRSKLCSIHTNKTALDQIMINLVGNAIKYCDKKMVEIEIGITENEDRYEFYVQDNGPGIPAEEHESIFQIFKTLALTDKFGIKGNGIGLATVKNLIDKMGGNIEVDADYTEGCRFDFHILKQPVASDTELALQRITN
ncbi:MAG: ATP-binding protein [Flavobacteriaceae bacterium]